MILTKKQHEEIDSITEHFENFDAKDSSCMISNIVIANLGVAIRMILPNGKVATFYRDGCEPTLRQNDEHIVSNATDCQNTERVFDNIFFSH